MGCVCHDSGSNNPGDSSPESLLSASVVKECLPEYVRWGCHLAESEARDKQEISVIEVARNRDHRVRLDNPASLGTASADDPAVTGDHAAGDDGAVTEEFGIGEERCDCIIPEREFLVHPKAEVRDGIQVLVPFGQDIPSLLVQDNLERVLPLSLDKGALTLALLKALWDNGRPSTGIYQDKNLHRAGD